MLDEINYSISIYLKPFNFNAVWSYRMHGSFIIDYLKALSPYYLFPMEEY